MKKSISILVLLLIIIVGILFYSGKVSLFSEYQNQNSATVSNNSVKTMKLKIALLSTPAQDGDMDKLKGCDLVSFQERELPITSTPVNAVLKELFSDKNYLTKMEFAPFDFISTQKDLYFDEALIEGDMVRVYLKGKVGPLAGSCDNPRIKTQIEQTVLQFPGIKKVEIYLNGVKNDFIFSEKGPEIEMMNLPVYIQDVEVAKNLDCSVTKRIVYQVPKAKNVADMSLNILFSNELSKYGVYKSVNITNSVARVTLMSDLTPAGYPIGSLSSCQSSHMLSVLKDTLTQYPTIKSVELYSQKGKIQF